MKKATSDKKRVCRARSLNAPLFGLFGKQSLQYLCLQPDFYSLPLIAFHFSLIVHCLSFH